MKKILIPARENLINNDQITHRITQLITTKYLYTRQKTKKNKKQKQKQTKQNKILVSINMSRAQFYNTWQTDGKIL